jgi:hypothetical protein
MPTLPLYQTPAHPDAWHRVKAPGGYEWWHFTAHDAAGAVRVRVDFFDGDPFNRAYQRAYRRYRRRPTRITPPLPCEYPCVRVEVTEGGRPLWRVDAPQPAGTFRGSEDGQGVEVGACSIRWDDKGGLSVSLERLQVSFGATLAGELAFRAPEWRLPGLRKLAGEEPPTVHFRLTSWEEYTVTGNIRQAGGAEGSRVIAFAGTGEYRHYVGTGPIGKSDVY